MKPMHGFYCHHTCIFYTINTFTTYITLSVNSSYPMTRGVPNRGVWGHAPPGNVGFQAF